MNLNNATTKKRQVISLGSFADLRTGALSIAVVTDGKKVQVDGFGVKRAE